MPADNAVQPLPVEPIPYYGQHMTNPLARVAKFLLWFGLLYGTLGLLGQIAYAALRITRVFRDTATPFSDPLTIGQAAALIVLIVSVITLLLGRGVGRRGLLVYAIFALGLVGVGFISHGIWRMFHPASSGWLKLNQVVASIFWAATNAVYPAVVLIFFREPTVREYFEGAGRERDV